MTADRALELDQFQERLERKGWEFCSKYFAGIEKYNWRAYKRSWGMCEAFSRTDRDDARAHALQWAEMTEGAVNGEDESRPTMAPERELRDTMPAPPVLEGTAAE